MADIVQEDQWVNSVIAEGIDKLAAGGMAAAKEAVKKHGKMLNQKLHANPKKAMGATAAVAGLGGYLAGKKKKKD
jgi:hypothetical protein